MALSLNITAQGGAVSGMDAQGRTWDVRYEGFVSAFDVWAAVNADGFFLAPGERFAVRGETPLVRA